MRRNPPGAEKLAVSRGICGAASHLRAAVAAPPSSGKRGAGGANSLASQTHILPTTSSRLGWEVVF